MGSGCVEIKVRLGVGVVVGFGFRVGVKVGVGFGVSVTVGIGFDVGVKVGSVWGSGLRWWLELVLGWSSESKSNSG